MSWLDHVRQAGQRTGRGVARLARAVQDAEGGPRVRRRLALALAIAAIAALAWTSVVRIGEAEVGVIVNSATGRLTVADRVGYRFAVSGLRTVHRLDRRVRTPTMADRAGPGDRPAPGRGAVRSFAPGVVAALLAATVCCSGAALLVDPGGGDGGLSPAEEPECRHLGGEAGATPRFLRENAGRYHEAIARARAWLDRLRVDPAELRAAGIKGKKKLVELLDAYVRLHAIVDLEERPEILARAWQVAAVTYTDGYHDMLAISDKHFKQDATSYLRTAYLMEGLGLDTTRFRREIRRIQGRLDGHMRRRGSHQRMAFHWYYGHFGLKEPFDLAAGFENGAIATRLAPHEYRNTLNTYHLTHEIFVPYEYGERLDVSYFSSEEMAYLRRTLDVVTSYYVVRRNPDLVAELVSCIRYLGLTDLQVYRTALDLLLSWQHSDGKWGDYERYRPHYGRLVEQGWYLHTTTVTVDALTIAFHFADDAPPGGESTQSASVPQAVSTPR